MTFPGEEKHGSRLRGLFLTLWMEHTVTVCDAVSESFQQHHLRFIAHEAASQVSRLQRVLAAVRLEKASTLKPGTGENSTRLSVGACLSSCADTTPKIT